MKHEEIKYSFSKVDTYLRCKLLFKYRYIDELIPFENYDDAAEPRKVGSAMHLGIEQGYFAAEEFYINSYPMLSDLGYNELFKLFKLIPKAQEILPIGNKTFEFELNIKNFIGDFKGFIDLIVEKPDGTYGLYDFKYSNNIDHYVDSPQIHLYKYFYNQLYPERVISELGYIFIPKFFIRQKKTETLETFRIRLTEELDNAQITLAPVAYDQKKVVRFFTDCAHLIKDLSNGEFTKLTSPTKECSKCKFCDYYQYCINKDDSNMILPKYEKRAVELSSRIKLYIYGDPFSGKTRFGDQFPKPLFLNTDGNLNSFTNPYLEIKDTFIDKGGHAVKISGWLTFKDAIKSLQTDTEYQTVVVDLTEDVYELARLYGYDQLGIKHESDAPFKAWDYIRNEFLATMKMLTTLPKNIVLISHSDMSRDLTKTTGDKITLIKPNIQDKIANKLAGMVDIVARVVPTSNGSALVFKTDGAMFGGGRIKITKNFIPATYQDLLKVYEEATK